MKLKHSFNSWFSFRKPKAAPHFTAFQAGDQGNPDGYIPRLTRYSGSGVLYGQVKSWVFSAVSLRAEDVSKTAFRLYKEQFAHGLPSIEEIFTHPAVRLIQSPHPLLSWYDLLYYTVSNMDVFGSFYWLKERDRLNVVRRFTPLFPWLITPQSDKHDFVRYLYHDANSRFFISRDDIIHFKHNKVNDLLQGQSILLAIADVINLNNCQLAYQLESFNQPIPPVSLQTDKDLGSEIAKALQADFKQKYSGIRRISDVPVLDNGLKLNIHKRGVNELDFTGSRKGLRDEILAAFRVPANKLGIVTDINKANAESADLSYLSNAIDPLCRYISATLTRDFRKEFSSPGLIVKNDDVVPADMSKKLRYYESGLKYKWLTVEEVRLMENFDPLNQ